MITLLLALTFQDLQDRPSKFGYELYREVRSEEKDKNVLVSPLSVYLALAMAYNGSGGETRDAMARVLRAEGLTLEDFNRAVASLQKSLTDADPKVKLAIANSLWVNEPVRFHEDFLKRSRDTFQAESVSLPFRDPATLRRINDWVSRNTNGKIEKILDEINPEMLGYLINAVYLKGEWKTQFDPKRTRDRAFTKLDGTNASKPMMTRTGEFEVLQTKAFDAVRLPYGKNERLKMYVFVPKDFEKFHESLDVEAWTGRFAKSKAEVTIPRFKIESRMELKPALTRLGMEPAFSNRADFSGMFAREPAKISRVIHKTYMDVDEEGTEAAAVTAIEMAPTSAVESLHILADRPFVIVLRDDTTKTNLFIGAIVNP